MWPFESVYVIEWGWRTGALSKYRQADAGTFTLQGAKRICGIIAGEEIEWLPDDGSFWTGGTSSKKWFAIRQWVRLSFDIVEEESSHNAHTANSQA